VDAHHRAFAFESFMAHGCSSDLSLADRSPCKRPTVEAWPGQTFLQS